MTAHFLKSELLERSGFRHAFFTRRGGVSEGPFRSLNFSSAVGDDIANVAENLELAARALGVPRAWIYFGSQVHGRDAIIVDGSEDRWQVLEREGDAVVSATPGVACSVRTADCVPILVADRKSGAVAALHAGWRGAVAGIVEAGVWALGGAATDFVAAIGPHISARAFEVAEDVAAELLAASPEPAVIDRSLGERPHVDLRRMVRAQLRAAGLLDAAIDDVFGCTVGDPDLFFSYRRDGKRSGRHLSAIVARPPAGHPSSPRDP
jgi:polyphenol oxidase